MVMEVDAIETITRNVRRRLRSGGAAERTGTERVIREELVRYTEAALAGAAPLPHDDLETERNVTASVTGFGALQPLLDDPSVEEIWVNAPDRVFVSRHGVSSRTGISLPEGETRRLVERMLRTSGRRLDLSSPFVDACLPDGSRVHAVIPDVTATHLAVNIRKFIVRDGSLDDLVSLGSLNADAARLLRDHVLAGRNIVVSGPTQSGKTTLLRALLGEVPSAERVVSIEETFELGLSLPDVVAMQCRQASLEGSGEVSLRRLVKEALRMRPDRIVVGEVREAEALDLLLALNSGVPGLCTVHANSATDALVKLAVLPLLAGENVTAEFIAPTVARCVHVVVHCGFRRSRRRVLSIVETTGAVSGGSIGTRTLYAAPEEEA